MYLIYKIHEIQVSDEMVCNHRVFETIEETIQHLLDEIKNVFVEYHEPIETDENKHKKTFQQYLDDYNRKTGKLFVVHNRQKRICHLYDFNCSFEIVELV